MSRPSYLQQVARCTTGSLPELRPVHPLLRRWQLVQGTGIDESGPGRAYPARSPLSNSRSELSDKTPFGSGLREPPGSSRLAQDSLDQMDAGVSTSGIENLPTATSRPPAHRSPSSQVKVSASPGRRFSEDTSALNQLRKTRSGSNDFGSTDVSANLEKPSLSLQRGKGSESAGEKFGAPYEPGRRRVLRHGGQCQSLSEAARELDPPVTRAQRSTSPDWEGTPTPKLNATTLDPSPVQRSSGTKPEARGAIHIGTIEIQVTAPAAAMPGPVRAASPHVSRALARGYGSSFGLRQS